MYKKRSWIGVLRDGLHMCGTLNNAAFSTPCMRLFAASRPNSAVPQTMGLMAAACLHVIMKASQTFNVTHIETPSLNIKNKTFILYNYNIQNFLHCISLLFSNFILPWVPHRLALRANNWPLAPVASATT